MSRTVLVYFRSSPQKDVPYVDSSQISAITFEIVKLVKNSDHDYKGFDDTILFGIEWPGAEQQIDNLIEGSEVDPKKNLESVRVTTHNKETYDCYLPNIVAEKPRSVEGYDGLTPLQLLKPLFVQKICSYRLESYWSYEVCHGRYIRQYHEEREGKQIKTQEYYLGHWSAEQQKELEVLMASPEYISKPKYTKIDGLTLAYVELEMGEAIYDKIRHEDTDMRKSISPAERLAVTLRTQVDGTQLTQNRQYVRQRQHAPIHGVDDRPFLPDRCPSRRGKRWCIRGSMSGDACRTFIINAYTTANRQKHGTTCDLNGKPRVTRVQYVCYTHGKHEVYSFKEVSTCEYEVIVLSPLLCAHPQFKPQESSENIISCIPVDGTPKKPRSLLTLEAESLKFHHQTTRLTNNDRDQGNEFVGAVLKVEKIEKDGETHLKFELHPLNEDQKLESETLSKFDEKTMKPITDDSPVRAFLNGENCLNGGSGWWKYEFCYGKYVEQYHVDRSGARTAVLLGRFDETAHLEWIKENKSKAPKPLGQRTYISHFYSDGDICDKTGKPRQTEVKLKCLENSSSSAQVSLYLIEPKTCHYILGVESPLICNILPLADENGLVKESVPFMNIVRDMMKVEATPKEETKEEKKESTEDLEND
ncbi:Endoplasmic reticulum lectin 1 [Eumeta japonica]|uniref:Endoplasmic reticulum lectin 1 n=1 Tax=Eumeta variegata TaxID=151549 RepID=A0A4C1YGT9_EUMVA|nr:Endoplasmic reticulum lectin 1 [Eumeta japonica]